MGEKLKQSFNRKLLLKYIAMVGAVSSFYPVILTTRLIFFKTSGKWVDFLLSAAIFIFGLLTGSLMAFGKSRLAARNSPTVSKKKLYWNLISMLIRLAAFSIPAALVLKVYSSEWIMRILFELLMAAVLYIISLRVQYKYTRILNRATLIIGILLVSITLLVVSFSSAYAHLRGTALFAGYLLMASAMIVRNQVRLDNVFTKDGRDIHDIPKSIRTYNTMILVLVFVFTILLFNLKWIVMSLLGIAGVVLQAAVWLAYKLMSMLFIKGGHATPLPPHSPNTAMQSGSSNNGIISIILNILAVLTSLYAAYIFARQLFSSFLSLWKKLLVKLSNADGDEIDDYKDEIGIVKPEGFSKGRKKIKKRSIKKDLKEITDPVKKIRYLYHAIIEALINRDIDIQKSDTTGEICMKSEQAEGAIDYVHTATAVYDKVRYGNEVPKLSEVSQVETSYAKLANILKKRL